MARSKTDSYITAAEREFLTYIDHVGLRACRECFHIRRGDLIRDDGACAWCHDEATPELELRISEEKLRLKRIRAKLDRLRRRRRPNLTKREEKP